MQTLTTNAQLVVGTTLVLVATLALATPLHAQHGSRGFRGGFGAGERGGMLPGLSELSLSDAQRDEIRGIAEASQETGSPLREQLRAMRRELNEAVSDEVVNESTIRALVAQIAPLEAEAAVQRAYGHSAILMVLTPDQRAELQLIREDARERFRERMQRRREERQQRQDGS